MFVKDIGIDLGTANILIYVKGEGIVLNEPSVLAIDKLNRVLTVGEEARDMLGRTPGGVSAIMPMKDGVIADFEKTEMMLEYFIKKIKGNSIFYKPKIIICCPSNITPVERNAIKEVAERTGARKVFVEEETKVAALGAGIDISKPNGSMVIDIGGGTTDIAVLSLGDIVTSASIKIAGNAFDNDIIKYIKDKYKLLIGERTAENIKFEIGIVYTLKEEKQMNVSGRNMINGLPSSITLTSDEIKDALKDSAYKIVHTAKQVLEITPPELSSDIIKKGVVLTGGGALIRGMDKLLKEELKIPVYVANSPLTCVAMGTGILLENINMIDN